MMGNENWTDAPMDNSIAHVPLPDIHPCKANYFVIECQDDVTGQHVCMCVRDER